MAITTSEILDILRVCDIAPEERAQNLDLPTPNDREFPEIGEIEEGETVYATSIAQVLGENDQGESRILVLNDPRIGNWWGEDRADHAK